MPKDPTVEELPLDALRPVAGAPAPARTAPLPGTGSAAPRPPAPLPGMAVPPPSPAAAKPPAPLPGMAVPPPSPAAAKPPAPLPGMAVPPPSPAAPTPPAPVTTPAVDDEVLADLDLAELAADAAGPAPTVPAAVPTTPVPAAAPVAATEQDLFAGLDRSELAADAGGTSAAPASAAATVPVEAPAAAPVEVGVDPLAGKEAREPLPPELIPDTLRKHVDPATPAKARMLAAKAMVPMAPRDQVHVLYQLTFDEHPKVAAAALETLAKLPERILDGVVGDARVAPQVLLALVEAVLPSAALSEKLLLNTATPDRVFEIFAERSAHEPIVEMVANNQQRLLRDHDIVRKLKLNEVTLKSTLERVVDFMVRSGVLLRDLHEFAESFSRLNQKELEDSIAHVEVPFELLAPEEQQRLKAVGKAPSRSAIPDLDLAALEKLAAMDDGMSLEDMDLLAQAEDQESAEDANRKQSALELLRSMTVAQQVKLAMVGNKEVRSLLLRSTVRMVAEAAVRSPRITEMEVIAAASSRSVQDSVIRLIASNREWVRLYQVKIALCNNPKTPMSFSMSYLRSLRLHDLKSIAKSKNIPSALTEQAKRLLSQKGGAG